MSILYHIFFKAIYKKVLYKVKKVTSSKNTYIFFKLSLSTYDCEQAKYNLMLHGVQFP